MGVKWYEIVSKYSKYLSIALVSIFKLVQKYQKIDSCDIIYILIRTISDKVRTSYVEWKQAPETFFKKEILGFFLYVSYMVGSFS